MNTKQYWYHHHSNTYYCCFVLLRRKLNEKPPHKPSFEGQGPSARQGLRVSRSNCFFQKSSPNGRLGVSVCICVSSHQTALYNLTATQCIQILTTELYLSTRKDQQGIKRYWRAYIAFVVTKHTHADTFLLNIFNRNEGKSGQWAVKRVSVVFYYICSESQWYERPGFFSLSLCIVVSSHHQATLSTLLAIRYNQAMHGLFSLHFLLKISLYPGALQVGD